MSYLTQKDMTEVVKLKLKFILSPSWEMISYFVVLVAEILFLLYYLCLVSKIGMVDVSINFLTLSYIMIFSLKVSALTIRRTSLG